MRPKRPFSVPAGILAALVLLFLALTAPSCGRSSVAICGQNIDCPPVASCDGGSCKVGPDSGPDGAACPGGQVSCAGECTNVANDPANCGACGQACGSGLTCSGSQCTGTCAAGSTRCGDVCVDLNSDPAHCGACAASCGTGQTCVGSKCGCSGSGQTACGAACVITQTDPLNCGGCGKACAGGQACANGSCSCPALTSSCDGSCRSFVSDSSNCGKCGLVCGATTPFCQTDACVSACTNPNVACGLICVNLNSDALNCGGCGSACVGGKSCNGGKCSCPAGFTDCNGQCVDVTADPGNCGGCGELRHRRQLRRCQVRLRGRGDVVLWNLRQHRARREQLRRVRHCVRRRHGV
jgi:hypothetical protein